MLESPWAQRIRRAEDLAGRYPFVQESLRFYQHLVRFQETLQASMRVQIADLGQPLHEDAFPLRPFFQEHHELLLPRFPGLLDLIHQIGPPALAAAAETLRSSPAEHWQALLEAYWYQDPDEPRDEGEVGPIDFFPKAFLQPYASLLASHVHGDSGEAQTDEPVSEGIGVCPLCGARAQVSVLRPESHGASRSLVCSLCATVWRFKRVHCVACGEEEFDRLVYQYAEEFPHVRMSACNTCRTYIKDVDLSKDLQAIPLVDEIATMPLDVIAAELGYHKLELNLIGM
jgi:formate dehydrogenase accessory protein FdhE